MHIHGKCHCGEISYTAEVSPGTVAVCHCTDCQIFAGSPYRAMIRPEAGTLEMSGSPKHYVKTGESGRARVQGFCDTCGSHIYAMDPDGGRMGLRIGAIAERAELGDPTVQVWCDSALPWVFDLAGVKQLGKQG